MSPGESREVTLAVGMADTAQALSLSPEDSFPAVFSTSRMIALMELAAARLMKPMLGPGELTVGVSVNVRHTSATPVGGTVRAVATYLAPEGKLFRFRVEAFDDAGPVGEGEHTRAIVSTERLLAGAARRLP
jgi:predicted thioesterase